MFACSRRPWFTVDVRDVAEAQVRMWESTTVVNGSRYLLTDMTRIHPEDVGHRLNDLFPQYLATTTLSTTEPQMPVHPIWDSVQTRNDLARAELKMQFTPLDESLVDCVESVIAIGGLQPRIRSK